MAKGDGSDQVREGPSLARASGWDREEAARKPQERQPFQTQGGSGPGEQEPGRDQTTCLGTYKGPELLF